MRCKIKKDNKSETKQKMNKDQNEMNINTVENTKTPEESELERHMEIAG